MQIQVTKSWSGLYHAVVKICDTKGHLHAYGETEEKAKERLLRGVEQNGGKLEGLENHYLQ